MSKSNTLELVQKAVEELIATMHTVAGFMVNNPVVVDGKRIMDDAIATGNFNKAIEVGMRVLSVGRSVLGAYIRYSIFDRKVEGEVADEIRPARFPRWIEARRREKFDDDLIEKLEVMAKTLEEAVETETNGSFTLRVETYNALRTAFYEVDAEQRHRDQVRRVRDEAMANFQRQTQRRRASASQLRSLL